MDILEKVYRNVRQHVINWSGSLPKTVDILNKSVSNVRLPPFTKDNVLYYYLPLQGLVSYTTLSVSVMNPHLMVRYVNIKIMTSYCIMIYFKELLSNNLFVTGCFHKEM